MLNTIDEVYDWLFSRRNPIKDKELKRIKYCINELDVYPTYDIVLVAGTNGKGSTANYIKDILKNTGKHIGLFTSPFVECFNERIKINDRYISNAELMYYTNVLFEFSNDYYQKHNDIIPFFELVLLMALMYYKDRSIDLAVMECGIGGLWDATNVLEPKLSIITNVGYDHTSILGNTLEEIANHKLGITRSGIPCITADYNIPTYIKSKCDVCNVQLINVIDNINNIKSGITTSFIYKGNTYVLKMLGDYQAYNAALAIEAVQILEPGIPIDLIKYGLEQSSLAGRFEMISNNPMIVLDGAHNTSAMEKLSNYISTYNKNIKVFFAALKDKNYKDMLNQLDRIASQFYFTYIDDIRSVDPNIFSNYITKDYVIFNTIEEAFSNVQINENDLLLVTGSLHFISLIKKIK